MNMNEAKFNSIFNGLSNNVKKVYASVPLTEKWDINQIHTDPLKRGCAGHLKDTAGSLNTLVTSGLILEPTSGAFMAIPVKKKLVKFDDKTGMPKVETSPPQAEQKPDPQPSTPTSNVPQSPIDRLCDLSSRVRDMMVLLQLLASDIDTAALEIEEQNAARDADSKKLRQLQQLLKSIA